MTVSSVLRAGRVPGLSGDGFSGVRVFVHPLALGEQKLLPRFLNLANQAQDFGALRDACFQSGREPRGVLGIVEHREWVEVLGVKLVEVCVGPQLGRELEGLPVRTADLERSDSQNLVVQCRIVTWHPVRTAEIARTVSPVGRVVGLFLRGFPQVASVLSEIEGQLQQIDLVPEEGRALLVGQRHKVAWHERRGDRWDVGTFQ